MTHNVIVPVLVAVVVVQKNSMLNSSSSILHQGRPNLYGESIRSFLQMLIEYIYASSSSSLSAI